MVLNYFDGFWWCIVFVDPKGFLEVGNVVSWCLKTTVCVGEVKLEGRKRIGDLYQYGIRRVVLRLALARSVC